MVCEGGAVPGPCCIPILCMWVHCHQSAQTLRCTYGCSQQCIHCLTPVCFSCVCHVVCKCGSHVVCHATHSLQCLRSGCLGCQHGGCQHCDNNHAKQDTTCTHTHSSKAAQQHRNWSECGSGGAGRNRAGKDSRCRKLLIVACHMLHLAASRDTARRAPAACQHTHVCFLCSTTTIVLCTYCTHCTDWSRIGSAITAPHTLVANQDAAAHIPWKPPRPWLAAASDVLLLMYACCFLGKMLERPELSSCTNPVSRSYSVPALTATDSLLLLLMRGADLTACKAV
jgi:hypothetical protein